MAFVGATHTSPLQHATRPHKFTRKGDRKPVTCARQIIAPVTAMRYRNHIPARYLLTAILAVAPVSVAYSDAAGIMDLYERALDSDAQYQASEYRYRADSLLPQVARSRLLPQINLQARRQRVAQQEITGTFFRQDSGGDSNQSRDYSYDTDDLSINLVQTLFSAQQYAELKQSGSQAERAGLELETARQQLILRLAEAYFSVLSAEETLTFARAEKQSVARQTEQARERFNVGLTAITDVKEAEAAYDLAEAEEIAADARLQNALYTLSVITGHDVMSLYSLAEEIPVIPPNPENMEAWVQKSLSQNIELLAQQITANIAAQEIVVQRSAHYPEVSLTARHSESKLRSGAPAPRDSEDFTIGIELNLPIFSGQGTHYRTRQASELHQEALQQLESMHREAKRATREAYLNVITSISRVAALQRAIESAQASLDANEAGFQVGTRTSVDVVLALKELFRARRDYADVRYDYLLNTLRLKKAVGTLEKDDIRRLDGYLQEPPSP